MSIFDKMTSAEMEALRDVCRLDELKWELVKAADDIIKEADINEIAALFAKNCIRQFLHIVDGELDQKEVAA